MAHRRIKIKPEPYVKKDGTISPKKLQYRVTCRSHGRQCFSEVAHSKTDAELLKDQHHAAHVVMHSNVHPNDLGQKIDPTAKQIPSRPSFVTVADNHTALRAYQKVSHTHE